VDIENELNVYGQRQVCNTLFGNQKYYCTSHLSGKRAMGKSETDWTKGKVDKISMDIISGN
jgi:hypothetical protein